MTLSSNTFALNGLWVPMAFGQGTSGHGGSCFGPFKLNGSKTTGSCTPSLDRLESVATDTFSERFGNGFETWPTLLVELDTF